MGVGEEGPCGGDPLRQMGRATSGMDDDEPIAEMPSFISSFEEGRAKLSRNLPTQTSFSDGKVERPVRDLSRRVSRSNSRLSLDGGEGEPGERSGEGERDAKGNNNNNCNGGSGGGARRRASAVEILRRNLGVSKSPSLNGNGWMQYEHETREGTSDSDVTNSNQSECDGWKKSNVETGDVGTENERTKSDFSTSDGQEVEFAHLPGQCHQRGVGDSSTATDNESLPAEEHVYCTVYCIAKESHRKEITGDATATSDAPEMAVATEPEASSGPEPALYTLDDLVDPFGDLAHRLSVPHAGAGATMQSCRVCLEEKFIVPLPCCKKAVCDECMKLYVSSQVGRGGWGD